MVNNRKVQFELCSIHVYMNKFQLLQQHKINLQNKDRFLLKFYESEFIATCENIVLQRKIKIKN